MGIEPMTPVLPRLCATAAPHGPTLPDILYNMCMGGQWRIRTSEAITQLIYSQSHLATLVTAQVEEQADGF